MIWLIIILVIIILVKIRQFKIEFRKNYGNVVIVVGGSGVGKTAFIVNEGLSAYRKALSRYNLECFKVALNNFIYKPYKLKEYPVKPLLYSNFNIYDRKGNVISLPIKKEDIINFSPLAEHSIVLLSELHNWFNMDYYKDEQKDIVTKWFSQQRHLYDCSVFIDSQEEDMLFNGIRRSRSDLIYILEGVNTPLSRKVTLVDYTTNNFERDENLNVSKFVRTIPLNIFKRYDSRFNREALKQFAKSGVKNESATQ